MQDVSHYNPEAEREILGNILLYNDQLDLINFLQPDHFFEPVHGRIFQAIKEMRLAGDQATPITLKTKFDKDGALSDIGGAAYLVNLAASASAVSSVPSLSRVIYQEWQKRKLVEWCNSAIGSVSESSPEEVANRLASHIGSLGSTDKRRRVKTDFDVAAEIYDDLQTNERPDSTGLTKLDECMGGGLYPGFVYGFGARKKVGKTILGGTLSYNLAQNGVKHIFLAGEMGSKQIHQRVMARMMGVYPSAFRNDFRNSLEFQTKFGEALNKHTKNALYQDVPNLTFDELKQYMAAAVNRYKVRGIIFDYWQLVGGAGREGERKHLDDVAQYIAGFSKENNIWSIVFSQMNQEGNTRGGEGLRNACDQMYEIHREDLTTGFAWVEMKDTRYTSWMNIGSADWAGWQIEERGLYFKEI